MSKFYYTYMIYINEQTSKFYGCVYFGKHVTANLLDGYIGSSKILKSYIKQHPNCYYFKILNLYNSKKDLNKAEYELIHPHLGKEYCLNLREGGEGGNTFMLKTEEEMNKIKNKISKASQRPCSEETKQKISEKKKNWYKNNTHPSFGKHLSEEVKRKLSEAAKNRPPRTEEHKKHLSESHMGLPSPIKGKHKVWDNKELNIYHMEI